MSTSADVRARQEKTDDLRVYLDGLVQRFEHPSYIEFDPIAIPHGFDDPRDQEVIGLFAALLAWGQRKTVLAKLADLCERMAFRPYRFVYDFVATKHVDALAGFKHRTFQPEDAVWLVQNLRAVLRTETSLENLFRRHYSAESGDIGTAIEGFSSAILTANVGTPQRLFKHVARPSTGSACKRLCMYARWMIRTGPFDLGVWHGIDRRHLVLPLDVHAGRQARALGLLERKGNDWKGALELTERCARLFPDDPARCDLALFGAGAYGVELDNRFLS